MSANPVILIHTFPSGGDMCVQFCRRKNVVYRAGQESRKRLYELLYGEKCYDVTPAALGGYFAWPKKAVTK